MVLRLVVRMSIPCYALHGKCIFSGYKVDLEKINKMVIFLAQRTCSKNIAFVVYFDYLTGSFSTYAGQKTFFVLFSFLPHFVAKKKKNRKNAKKPTKSLFRVVINSYNWSSTIITVRNTLSLVTIVFFILCIII